MKVKIIPQVSYRVETEDGRFVGDFLLLEEWHGLRRIHERGNELTVFSQMPGVELTEVVMGSPDLLVFIKNRPAQSQV